MYSTVWFLPLWTSLVPPQWIPATEDHVLWPHVPVLHMIATALPMHILLPDRDGSLFNIPHDSLTFNQYWFIQSQDRPVHWPRALANCISTFALLDWVHPIHPKGIFVGTVMWVMVYGYSEHSRYITAIECESVADSVTRARRYKQAFQSAFTKMGLPAQMEQQDYRVQLQSQQR